MVCNSNLIRKRRIIFDSSRITWDCDLFSEDTYLLVKDHISCRNLELITVKNITHPIQAYEAIGPINSNAFQNDFQEASVGFPLFTDPQEIDNVNAKKEILSRALEELD